MRLFGHAFPGDELSLIVRLTPGARAEPPVVLSVAQMTRDIHDFQCWFANYGLEAIGRRRLV
jgi:hypothetical protein